MHQEHQQPDHCFRLLLQTLDQRVTGRFPVPAPNTQRNRDIYQREDEDLRKPFGAARKTKRARVCTQALIFFGRSERIRTSDPFNPIEVRYQAALRSEKEGCMLEAHAAFVNLNCKLDIASAERHLSEQGPAYGPSPVLAGAGRSSPRNALSIGMLARYSG